MNRELRTGNREPEFDGALRALEARLTDFERAGDGTAAASALAAIGVLHRDAGRPRDAIHAFEMALDRARRTAPPPDPEVVLHLIRDLAMLLRQEGAWSRARELYLEACRMAEAAGDRAGLAETLAAMGDLHYARREWEQAALQYDGARRIREALGDRKGLARVWNNIGGTLARMWDGQGALAALRASQEIQESLGDRLALSITLGNIGSVLHGEGRLREAQDYLERAARVQEELGDTQACAGSLNTLGTVQKKLGNLPAALATYARTRGLMAAAGDDVRASVAMYNMAIIHEERGEFREALDLLEAVVRIEERLAHPDLPHDREALERVRRRLQTEGERNR